MYFAQDIYALFVFITIEFVVIVITFLLLERLIPYLFNFIWSKLLFMMFVKPDEIRIHEAGHLVAYLRTCKDLSQRNYLRKIKRINEMGQSRIGGYINIDNKEWNYRNRLLILGGVAAVLKTKKQEMNKNRYRLYFYLKGCYSDFYKLRHFHHMSKQQIIFEVNSMINSFSDSDMQFIKNVANDLAIKEEQKYKNTRWTKRILSQEELFELAKDYYKN